MSGQDDIFRFAMTRRGELGRHPNETRGSALWAFIPVLLFLGIAASVYFLA